MSASNRRAQDHSHASLLANRVRDPGVGGHREGPVAMATRGGWPEVVAICLFVTAVPNLLRLLSTRFAFESRNSLGVVVGSQYGFLAAAALLAWAVLRRSPMVNSQIVSHWVKDVAAFVVAVAGMAATGLLLSPSPMISRGTRLMSLITDSVNPALTEEIVFRGLLPLVLTNRLNAAGAPSLSPPVIALVTSACFAAAHWNTISATFDWQPMLSLFCNGLILAVLSGNGRRLLPPMLAHALFDAALVPF